MKYTLDLKWIKTIDIEAESRIEALAKAKELLPNHTCDYMGDAEGNSTTVDYCEGCNKPIFSFDEEITACYEDEYGNRYCSECGGEK